MSDTAPISSEPHDNPHLPTPTDAESTRVRDTAGPALDSERVVLSSPTSFHGSAARIWPLTKVSTNSMVTWFVLIPSALVLITLAWMFVLGWYTLWGLYLVPYRLVRRSQRRRKMENLRHREMLTMMKETGRYRQT